MLYIGFLLSDYYHLVQTCGIIGAPSQGQPTQHQTDQRPKIKWCAFYSTSSVMSHRTGNAIGWAEIRAGHCEMGRVCGTLWKGDVLNSSAALMHEGPPQILTLPLTSSNPRLNVTLTNPLQPVTVTTVAAHNTTCQNSSSMSTKSTITTPEGVQQTTCNTDSAQRGDSINFTPMPLKCGMPYQQPLRHVNPLTPSEPLSKSTYGGCNSNGPV